MKTSQLSKFVARVNEGPLHERKQDATRFIRAVRDYLKELADSRENLLKNWRDCAEATGSHVEDVAPWYDRAKGRRGRLYQICSWFFLGLDMGAAGYLGARLFNMSVAAGAVTGAVLALTLKFIAMTVFNGLVDPRRPNLSRRRLGAAAIFFAMLSLLCLLILYFFRLYALPQILMALVLTGLGIALPAGSAAVSALAEVLAHTNSIAKAFARNAQQIREAEATLESLEIALASIDRQLGIDGGDDGGSPGDDSRQDSGADSAHEIGGPRFEMEVGGNRVVGNRVVGKISRTTPTARLDSPPRRRRRLSHFRGGLVNHVLVFTVLGLGLGFGPPLAQAAPDPVGFSHMMVAVDVSGSLDPDEYARVLAALDAGLEDIICRSLFGLQTVECLSWAAPKDAWRGAQLTMPLPVRSETTASDATEESELTLLFRREQRRNADAAEHDRAEAVAVADADFRAGVARAIDPFGAFVAQALNVPEQSCTCFWPVMSRLTQERPGTLSLLISDAIDFGCGDAPAPRPNANGQPVIVILVVGNRDDVDLEQNLAERKRAIAQRFPNAAIVSSYLVREDGLWFDDAVRKLPDQIQGM